MTHVGRVCQLSIQQMEFIKRNLKPDSGCAGHQQWIRVSNQQDEARVHQPYG
jgi:hypothetical protein